MRVRIEVPPTVIAALLLFAVFAAPLSAQLTGTWSGTYSLTQPVCPGTFTGPATLYATQSDGAFTAVLDIEMKFFDDCTVSTHRLTLPISGNISGNNFSGMIFAPFGDEPTVPFAGTVSGNAMTAVSEQPTTTVTLTLTRSSSFPPDAPIAGTYSGTYQVSNTMQYDPCVNLPVFTYSGAVSATLLQGDQAIAGSVELRDVKDTDHDNRGNCTIIDMPDERPLFTGTIADSVISGSFVAYDINLPVTATVIGDTITGSGGDESLSFSFSLTRTAVSAAPMVLEFSGEPPTIRPGQEATLQWTVFNVVSLTIDHGVGSRPATGTATVTPPSTTTYTLTASASNGMTDTAETTVIVASVDAPVILTWTATPGTILAGTCSMLAWTTTNATSVSIDHGIGSQAVNGSTLVCPPATTMYRLTATGEGGSDTRSLPLRVVSLGRRRAVRH